MIVSRRAEENWLTLSTQLGKMCLIGGLKGSGKTTLIRHWLAQKNLTHTIYTFTSFTPFSKTLGQDHLSPEQALEKIDFGSKQVFVWDDFHFLSQMVRGLILEFVKRADGKAIHIFITEENLSEDIQLSIPSRVLDAWSREEMAQLVNGLQLKLEDTEIDSLHEGSGGLPGLAILQLLSPQKKNTPGSLLKDLTGEEELALSLDVIVPRIYTRFERELQTILGEEYNRLKQGLQKLEKKFFAVDQGSGIEVNPLIRDQYQKKADWNAVQKLLVSVLKELPLSPLEKLVAAFRSQIQELVSEFAHEVNPDALEEASAADLAQLLDWVGYYEKKLSGTPLWGLQRLKLRTFVLLGRRQEALDFGSDLLGKLSFDIDEGIFKLWLAYDIIYWMNRSGLSEKVEGIIPLVLNRSPQPLKSYLKIEQALPFYGKDTERAAQHLIKTAQEMEGSPDKDKMELAKAQVYFELGLVSNMRNKPIEAADWFGKSASLFAKYKKTYFQSFCLINRVFIFSAAKDWEACAKELESLKDLLKKYNYPYVKAGQLFIEGWMKTAEGKIAESFELLSEASIIAKKSGTQRALGDIMMLRARLYHWMGLDSQALLEFSELRDNKSVAPSSIQQLELELELKDQTLEDWSEVSSKLSSDISEFQWYVLLSRGTQKMSEQEQVGLRKSFITGLSLSFNLLLSSLKSESESDISTRGTELENVLRKFPDARPERAGLYLIQALLQPNEQGKTEKLDKARFEILRWSADPGRKTALDCFLSSAKSNQDPSTSAEWKSLPIKEKERWSPILAWMQKRSVADSAYIENSLAGQKPVDDIPTEFPQGSVVYIESTNKIYKGKKQLLSIQSRPVMRNTLSLLLELYPRPVPKSTFSTVVWGEEYSPQIHDARIYTSIQRLRTTIGSQCIQNWENGYRWNPNFPFFHFRSTAHHEIGQHTVKTLILELLRKFEAKGQKGVKRSVLVEGTESSDSTVKRVLAELLAEGKIGREGKGPSVTYFIK